MTPTPTPTDLPEALAIMRWNVLPGGIINPSQTGMYVRYEDHAAALSAAAPAVAPHCATCNDNGLIGGPSFADPGEGGVPCPDCTISREQWIGQAMRVYLIAGDTEQVARECATYLWGEVDKDDLPDATDAAMEDVEGRGPAPQAGAESYPPLPKPLYEEHDYPSMGEVTEDCYTEEQMRAYADATAALRARGAVPSDARRTWEGLPFEDDSVVFQSGKAAGRQEVKDAQSSPDFVTWIREAYRDPEKVQYTIHNMEVAYQAGRAAAPMSAPPSRVDPNTGIRTPSWEELRNVWERLGAESKGISWDQFTTGLRMTNTIAAPAPTTEQAAPATRDQIREVFLQHGFTVKEGQTDLKEYVYDAAYALLALAAPAPTTEQAGAPRVPAGWKLVKQARLDAIAENAVDPSKRAYLGRNLYDEQQVHANWDACQANLSNVRDEIEAIQRGWDDEDLSDAIAAPGGEAPAEDARDAARYRWLREQGTLTDGFRHPHSWRCVAMLADMGGEHADAAIDAAMAAQSQKGAA